MWGSNDTLNYLVSSFRSAKDATIGDVLKKMPGIHVNSSGSIEYKGVPINKFYIEGLDLLKGRYGIATNNLAPDNISIVQVLENYQPVKALQKIEISNQAAINIKLKSSAKGIFSLTSLSGGGYGDKLLMQEELLGSYFGRNKQTLITYKGNNIGKDVDAETRDLGNNDDNGWLTRVLTALPPSIDKRTYFDNKSHSVTTNILVKDKSKNTLNCGLFYTNDEEKRDGSSSVTYMLPNGILNRIDESLSSKFITNRLVGEGSYTINKDKNYLCDTFSAKAEWLKGDGTVASAEDIMQRAKHNDFKLSNKLYYINKSSEYSGFSVESSMKFNRTPQNLYVYPCTFPELKQDNGVEGLHQSVGVTNFLTKNSIRRLSAFVIGDLHIAPGVLFNLYHDRLNSTLTDVPNSSSQKSYTNDAYLLNSNAGVSTELSYNSNNISFNVYLPLSYNYKKFNRKDMGETIEKNKLVFEPITEILFKVRQWSLDLSYTLNNNYVEIGQLYSGYILSDYRTLCSYEPRFNDNIMHQIGSGIAYKDIFKMLFVNLKASFSSYKTDMLYGQEFNGNLSKITALPVSTYGNMFKTSLNISKAYIAWKASTEFNCGVIKRSSPHLRQKEVLRYYSDLLSINGRINVTPCRWFNINCEEIWNRSWSHLKTGERFTPISTLESRLTTCVTLPFGLIYDSSIYNYYNSNLDQGKSFSIANMGLQYTWKRTTLYLEWNNILNVDCYKCSYLDELTRYNSCYNIRPSSILFKVRLKIF